jgi:hypothetical protein
LAAFLVALLVFAAPAQSAGGRCLVVDKAKREVSVFEQGRRLAAYPASFGIDPVSDKRKAFDCATPEGLYFVSYKKDVTRFHRTLGLSFPGLADAEKALSSGLISIPEFMRIRDAARKSRPGPCNTGLGCGIAIHGGGVFRQFGQHRERDWTEGCIALDNPDVEKLFAFCRPGDQVVIFNSEANLFALARPFSLATNLDADGLPQCPQGVCVSEARFMTALGPAVVRVTEGALWSVQATVRAPGDKGRILLTFVDRNADGRMSFQDSASGPLAEGRSLQETYAMLRQAVADALSSGTCLAP